MTRHVPRLYGDGETGVRVVCECGGFTRRLEGGHTLIELSDFAAQHIAAEKEVEQAAARRAALLGEKEPCDVERA